MPAKKYGNKLLINVGSVPDVDTAIQQWDAYQKLCKGLLNETDYQKIQVKEKDENDPFVVKYGELGPVYGKQWRDFNGQGIDQVAKLVDSLRNNPFSRRHIICAWNPAEVDSMALPPCHSFLQFYVSNDKKYLSCQLYQRSADTFLGVPFNIASYAMFTAMLAQVCGYEAKEFVHTIGDAHIYKDHFDVVREQISREPFPKCKLVLNPEVKDIFDFKIVDYIQHFTGMVIVEMSYYKQFDFLINIARTYSAKDVLHSEFSEQQHDSHRKNHHHTTNTRLLEKQHRHSNQKPHKACFTDKAEKHHQVIEHFASEIFLYKRENRKINLCNIIYHNFSKN